MSIHSFVASNITDYDTLTTVLTETGIAWQPVRGMYMKATGLPPVHALQAVIGGDTVVIWQQAHGQAFQFQSQGWTFRDKRRVEMIAATEPEAVRRHRAQLEQQSRMEEQRRREEERCRQEEAGRQRRLEEERRRQEEEKRQKLLAEEAAQVLGRLDSTFRIPVPPAPPVAPMAEPPPPVETIPAANKPSDDQLNELIGKLHQKHARRKILQHREELEERGFSLESAETLEDQTIELRFRG